MKKKYYVEKMSCAACVSHVEDAVRKIKGIEEVSVNLFTKEMYVTSDKDYTNQIIKNVSKAGYVLVLEDNYQVQNNDNNKKLIKLILSLVLSFIIMYFAMGKMLGLPVFPFMNDLNNAVFIVFPQVILSSIVILLNYNIFIDGFKKLFVLKPNMNSLITLGSSCSYLFSIYSFIILILNKDDLTIANKILHNLYFDSSAMVLALVVFGKYLESRSTNKTKQNISDLMKLIPDSALLCDKDGNTTKVLINEVKENDIILVNQGMIIPVDGIVVDGKASIDESKITGESKPVYKEVNSEVTSSGIVVSGAIKVKALKVMEETTISKIIKLVDEASNSKAPISRFVDKVAGIFSFIVMGIAFVAFVLYLLLGFDISFALNILVSVLVVSCPCALGLATPVAIICGTGVAAKHNLIIRNAEVLEHASLIKSIILDKTGTITKGMPEVVNIYEVNMQEKELLEIAYSLEELSSHPFAHSIKTYCKDKNITKRKVNSFNTIEGVGVSGEIDNKMYYCGNLRGIEEIENINKQTDDIINKINNLYENGSNIIIVYDEKDILGLIEIKDTIKDTSKEAIKKLKSIGVKPIMVTGDKKEVANIIAKEVDIDTVYSQVMPSEKANIVNLVKENTKGLVACAGDGVNDAIALVASDCSFAIGSGTDVAIDSSDIILLSNDLLSIYYAIKLSKRVMRTIKINLFWAFFYNLISISLACGVLYFSYGILLTPMIAALSMSLSSLFVVFNALLINKFKIEEGERKMQEISLFVPNMNCGHCVARISATLEKVKGLENISVNLENKKVSFIINKDKLKEKAIKAIKKEGFEVIE